MAPRIFTAGRMAVLLLVTIAAGLAPAWAQKSTQTIRLTNSYFPTTLPAGSGYPIFAEASSGLPVTFATAGACHIALLGSWNIVSTHAQPGATCTVTALQAGNEVFEPASLSLSIFLDWNVLMSRPGASGTTATGDEVRMRIYFTDNGPLAETTCAIDWGDPTAPVGQPGVAQNDGQMTFCEFTHDYPRTGYYRVTATMSDPRFGTQSRALYVTVSHLRYWTLTGGGRFESPPGTFAVNPALSGTVTLQLDLADPSDPSPWSAWFALESPSARFTASTLDLWHVTETTAYFIGSGTDHEGTTFFYSIDVRDGGGAGPDLVRLRLVDGAGRVVYDTQPGAWESEKPTMPLDGNIVITQP